jgi:hypothetical protein
MLVISVRIFYVLLFEEVVPQANRCGSDLLFLMWQELTSQQTYYDCKQRSTFYQSGSQDHVATDVANCFRLTSDRLQCAFANQTYADAGS